MFNARKNTASLLKSSDRRQFMGNVVNLMGRGGQCFAEQVLGWNRVTVRKGQTELRRGQAIEDRFRDRGRRRIEERLANLLDEIRSIVEPSGQTDPTFRSTRICSPLSAAEVRLRLITQRDYKDRELPCARHAAQQAQRPRLSVAQGQEVSAAEEDPGNGRDLR